MIRQAGAREVHMRISSPPTTHPCFYGIDTPTRSELIASAHSVDEIRDYLGADSLAYLSERGMYAFTRNGSDGFCDACFTGRYPVPPADDTPVRQLHLFEARDRRTG
jgi:amidophosphoribosyltransferase